MKLFIYLFSTLLSTTFLLGQFEESMQDFEKKCSASNNHSIHYLNKSSDKQLVEEFNFDVRFYDLKYHLDIERQKLYGETTIYARTLKDLQKIGLDFSDNMQVDSIFVNSIRHTEFIHQDYRINITLENSIELGREFMVRINYSGFPAATGFGAFDWSTLSTGEKVFWSLSEPYGAREWWPCQDTPQDKADSVYISVSLPEGYKVASNGILVNIEPHVLWGETHTWKHRYPIATYLVAIAGAPYVEINDTYTSESGWSMQLQHFLYPSAVNSTNLAYLDDVKEMLDAFNHYFGDYPFKGEKYGIANFGWGGGMEHQTMTYQGGFYTGLTSHELGHQWFGDNVTCADFHHIWLNEGFASYSEALYAEWIGGKEAYMAYIESDFFPYSLQSKIPIYVENPEQVSDIFNRTVYDKGACVVHMLRQVIDNDALFFDMLRDWNSDIGFKDSSATTEDLSDFISEYIGEDFSWFFDDWIYQDSHPIYSASWETFGHSISIKLSQDQDPSHGFYRMPVPLKFINGAMDTIVVVFNDRQDQVFNLHLNFTPTVMEIDPEQKILREINSIDKEIIPEEFVLVGNFPNPFNPGTSIQFKCTTESQVDLAIYNSIGRRIREINGGTFSTGTNAIYWNGLSNKGVSSASGTYFYQLKVKDGKKTSYISGKMQLIK